MSTNFKMCGRGGLAFVLLAASWGAGQDAPLGEGSKASETPAGPGSTLYVQHCAGCHGLAGDGKGVATTFLFPKPRDFRRAVFKLVSTENNVPSAEDLETVLLRGMPGSSMPSWAHLTVDERRLLAAEVYRFMAEGARDRYVATLKEEQELTDDELQADDIREEIAEFVASKTVPEAQVEVPLLRAADEPTIMRGKALYVKQGCVSCHGTEGKGDGVKQMIDDEGFATFARDLTRGIYKGADDPASLFLRVVRGMPGTPMPSAPTLTPPEVAEMVHFLRSLSTDEQRQSVVLRRKTLVATRVAQLPEQVSATDWSRLAPVPVQTYPLWWRDDAEPSLSLQLAHDGHHLMVRMTWKDTTHNASAVGADQFEDMAALELYRGKAEPFLGMGSHEGLVDLWAWRGGREDLGTERSQLDDYPFDTPIYHELVPAGDRPDFLTARASGNPIAVRDTTASQLIARGPGSTTFMPRPSQVVSSVAAWENGQWTVVFRRPLTVKEGGLDLSNSDSCSVAFAIWDGAFRDRGGQKMVSLWNDLRIE